MSRIAQRPTHTTRDPERGYLIQYNRHPKRKNNFKVAEMYDCYRDGMSLATIAKLYGCRRQAVYDVFRSRGYKLRTKKLKGARIVDGVRYTFDGSGYLRGTLDGKRVYLHQLVWRQAHGPVPHGYQIRFKDSDRGNCSLDNLKIVSLTTIGKTFNPTGKNQYSV